MSKTSDTVKVYAVKFGLIVAHYARANWQPLLIGASVAAVVAYMV